MKFQLGEIFGLHRAECTQADVQRDASQLHPSSLQSSQQLIAEMKPRRWCRHGTRAIGITRLVPLHVLRVMPIDVRGKWDFTALIEQTLDGFRIRTVRRKLNDPAATGGIFRHHHQPD
ncbi:MAG: Uncharacterised protein [Synechococcus sp. CC9902]|nr:MAG: Uncharacterised protein [Synechococcus sp. CC9902]